MFLIIILFLFYQLQASQNTEIVVYFNGQNTKIVRFEIDLIRNLFEVYKKKYNENIIIRYKGVKRFNSIFTEIEKEDRDSVLAINQLSITKERQKFYDFSIPYLTNRFSILSKNFISKDRTDIRLAYQKKSIFTDMLPAIKRHYKFKLIALEGREACLEALLKKKVDMILTDFVDSWIFDLKLVAHVNNLNDEYGILFPKGSILYKKFNKIFSEYVKSNAYKKLMKKHFKSYEHYFQINDLYSMKKQN